MPLVDGIGISEHTIDKQSFLLDFLRAHIKISDHWDTRRRRNRYYYYFDMNAGSGVYDTLDGNTMFGSPLQFLRVAHVIHPIKYKAIFCEADIKNCKYLAANIDLIFSIGVDDSNNESRIERTNSIKINGHIASMYNINFYKPDEPVPERIEYCFINNAQGYPCYRCAYVHHQRHQPNDLDDEELSWKQVRDYLGREIPDDIISEVVSGPSGPHGHAFIGPRPAVDYRDVKSADEIVYILNCNSRKGMPRFSSELFPSGNKHGLMYIDPNGIDIAIELLHRLSRNKNYDGIDFLIHLAAGTYKRVRRNQKTGLEEPLDKALGRIKRAQWYISKPHGAHQWVFLFGTTRKKILKFKSPRLYYTGNPIGEKLLYELSYTPDERRKGDC